jgi:hypothetical protein
MPTNVLYRFLGLLPLVFSSAALAQTGGTLINPISNFQVQEGSTAVSWSQNGTSVDPTTGNSVITFQDGNGGTSTMTWLSTGTLSSWAINLASGGTQVYTDGVGQGEYGTFVLTGGAAGSNPVLSVNGHAYVVNGNVLQPATIAGGSSNATIPLVPAMHFTYGGVIYQFVSCGTDYAGTVVANFANGASTFTFTELSGLQFYFPNGSYANYSVDSTGRNYTYQTTSTATNQLTQINGNTLAAMGKLLVLPICITSFVFGGLTYNFGSVVWYASAMGYSTGLTWTYTCSIGPSAGGTGSGDNGTLNDFGAGSGSGTVVVRAGSSANTYILEYTSSSSQITAINGIPYVTTGSTLVPQGPVSGFAYGGNSYQFTGYGVATDGTGNWLAQYQTTGANPQTATVEYSPGSDAFAKMSINTGSGTATYVNGASVGQPGAYVWSSTSTAPNQLTTLNNSSYTAAGDSDLPSTATSANGVFQIKGNFMSLGTWSSNANQAGLNLAYYDAPSTTAPASIEWTASRPLTSWVWDAASQDGTVANAVMQLDQTSQLLLYPQANAQSDSTTPPTATIVLDPNPTGTSSFAGPVLISQQGDLSMGQFTAQPSPSPTP